MQQYEPVAYLECLPTGKAFPTLQIRRHVAVSICCKPQYMETKPTLLPEFPPTPSEGCLAITVDSELSKLGGRVRIPLLVSSPFRGQEYRDLPVKT